MYAWFFESPHAASAISNAAAATHCGENNRRIGLSNPRRQIPAALIAWIAATAPNRRRHSASLGWVASGARDPVRVRPDDAAERRGFDHRGAAPGGAVGEQRRQQASVQGMARSQPAKMPD